MEYMPNFSNCPRCGDESLERLRSHTYCVNCDFSSVLDEYDNIAIPDWAFEGLGKLLGNPKILMPVAA